MKIYWIFSTTCSIILYIFTLMPDNKYRQAVVIIHGIGEQRPMSTLRGFVFSLLNYERRNDESRKIQEWIKPDRISKSYELRKISVAGVENVRSTTHFYEYHWAANMRDSRSKHVYKWLWSLMTRDLSSSPFRIRVLRSICVIALLCWILFGLLPLLYFLLISSYPMVSNLVIKWVIWTFLPLVLLHKVMPNILIGYIGDAARYLSGDVDNIAQREIIRENGIAFLKNLHKSGGYDRIILAGHSLGSVIAYDLITYLWIDFNKSIKLKPKTVNKEDTEITETQKETANENWHSELDYSEEKISKLSAISQAGLNLQKEPENVTYFEEYRRCQDEFRHEISQGQKGWLISDLITMGCPLTHGDLLMADSEQHFRQMKEERQYPTCPPSKDSPPKNKKIDDILPEDYFVYENISKEKLLNHATPFFATRWSNIFYEADLIGGPLKDQFGPGILDIPVDHEDAGFKKCKKFKKWFHDKSPGSHNHYWADQSERATIMKEKESRAIEKIYQAMRLADLTERVLTSMQSSPKSKA